MSSAQLQFDPFDLPTGDTEAGRVAASASVLKQQVADRLAAHRTRRSRHADSNVVRIPNLREVEESGSATQTPSAKAAAGGAARSGTSRAGRIAAAVAERYAHSTTYREFLAAEAERAIAEANATAEVAARNAEAVTAVQQQLLAELDLWDEPTESQAKVSMPEMSQPFRDPQAAPALPELPLPATSTAPALTVRLYEDVGLRQPELRVASAPEPHDDEALNHLDEEIAFRRAPVFDEPSTPPVPIPANLIEFPRQLVAARKSRPRIAEGPLREEADAAPAVAQLRIFEVDAAQFSSDPVAEAHTSLPEWSSIYLDATPHLDAPPVLSAEAQAHEEVAASSEARLQMALYVPIQVAPLGYRVMAAAVDGCLLGATFLAAVSAFAYAVKSLPTGPVALIASAATLLVLFVIYQMLFFTLSCATPGMRYARIGLCTFSDDNPTRAEMRRRVWLILLAACPLGLGILWAALDEDSLGWHDRLSRIYQRSY